MCAAIRKCFLRRSLLLPLPSSWITSTKTSSVFFGHLKGISRNSYFQQKKECVVLRLKPRKSPSLDHQDVNHSRFSFLHPPKPPEGQLSHRLMSRLALPAANRLPALRPPAGSSQAAELPGLGLGSSPRCGTHLCSGVAGTGSTPTTPL